MSQIYLVVFGLQRARDLRAEDDYSFDTDEESQPNSSQKFTTILREGPSLGIHSVVWSDTYGNLMRILERRTLRDFVNKVVFQMGADDSSNLIDTPIASKLGRHRAFLSNEDEGQLEKFRPYDLPSSKWLESVMQILASRITNKGG